MALSKVMIVFSYHFKENAIINLDLEFLFLSQNEYFVDIKFDDQLAIMGLF